MPVKIYVNSNEHGYWLERYNRTHECEKLPFVFIDERDWAEYLDFLELGQGWSDWCYSLEQQQKNGGHYAERK